MRILTLFALFLSLGPAHASSGKDETKHVLALSEQAWNSPLIGFGAKANDAYTDGHLFLTLPLWSSIGLDGKLAGDYLLIEPYTSLGEQGEVATSLGLSWRHLFSHQSLDALKKAAPAGFMDEGLYIGANIFFDMLDTQNDNRFWQLGLGAEIGTRYLELRGNYYLPLTDRELVQRTESVQTITTSQTQYKTVGSASSTGGAPFATGNQIVQDYGTQTTYATTTSRTTTIRTVTELFEDGMEGWDAELAILIPRLDKWMDVRLLAGYFSLDNQPFGPQGFGTGNVEGWKAGIEVRPVPALLLTAMWYEDQRFTGANWTVGVQFQIPLGREWKEAFRPRRRHLVERLAEPVRRQNDAIKVGNDLRKKEEKATTVARVTKVVNQSPGRVVLLDDVIFVNGGSDAGNGIQEGDVAGDGTAEHPVIEISDGAAIAENNNKLTGRVWNVYTQGGSSVFYSQEVQVNASANFVSSATIIKGPDGQSFGTGDRPLLTERFSVRDAASFSIKGYEIDASSEGSALDLDNVRSGVVTDNIIFNGGGRGVDIAATNGGSSSVTFSNNSVQNTTSDIVSFFSDDDSTLIINFNANTLQNSAIGDGIDAVRSASNSVLNFSGTQNNSVSGIGGGKFLYNQTGTPTGSFILNGTSVSSGSDH